MRTFGRPSGSTVDSAMALGSRGSLRDASSNQAANSRNGSSASVKSPLVNELVGLIGAASDIRRSFHVAGSVTGPRQRVWSRQNLYRATAASRLWRGAGTAAAPLALALALACGGCSYQLGSMFDKQKSALRSDATGSVAATSAPRSEPVRLASGEIPADADLI